MSMQYTSNPPLKVAPFSSNLSWTGGINPAPANTLRVVIALGKPATPLYLPVATIEDAPVVVLVNHPVVVNLPSQNIVSMEIFSRNLQSPAAPFGETKSAEKDKKKT